MKEQENSMVVTSQNLWEKTILTMKEAVIFTGLSKNTLYRLTSEKKLTYYKPGGKMIIFRRQDLEDFMFSNPQ